MLIRIVPENSCAVAPSTGPDLRRIAHQQLYVPVEFQSAFHHGSRADDDAGRAIVIVVEVGLLHMDAALDARAVPELDIACVRADALRHMRGDRCGSSHSRS